MGENNKTQEEKFALYTEKVVGIPKKYKRTTKLVLFVLAACAFGVIVTLVVNWLYPKVSSGNNRPALVLNSNEKESQTNPVSQDDIQRGIERAKQSVVLISAGENDVPYGSNFATYTGAIMYKDDNGCYILTRNSYINDSSNIAVKFNNYKVDNAQRVNYQSDSDIAILFVATGEEIAKSENIKACSVGDIDSIRQGQRIFTIGRILGYSDTLKYGMCESISNTKNMPDITVRVMNTDILGNQGDDGFIFDAEGNLLAVNYVDEGSSVSAIAVEDMKLLIEKLANEGEIPYIGLYGTSVTEEIMKSHNLPRGVYISDFDLYSPAFRSGLQVGDVIIAINDNEVTAMSQITEAILNTKVGDKINLKIKRHIRDDYMEAEYEIIPEKR